MLYSVKDKVCFSDDSGASPEHRMRDGAEDDFVHAGHIQECTHHHTRSRALLPKTMDHQAVILWCKQRRGTGRLEKAAFLLINEPLEVRSDHL